MTGELVWILGNHANWREPWQPKLLTPLGDDFEWQYHQHDVELSPGGIGLYDAVRVAWLTSHSLDACEVPWDIQVQYR